MPSTDHPEAASNIALKPNRKSSNEHKQSIEAASKTKSEQARGQRVFTQFFYYNIDFFKFVLYSTDLSKKIHWPIPTMGHKQNDVPNYQQERKLVTKVFV